MTYLVFHLKDLWDMLTGSPWPIRVFLTFVAIFFIITLVCWHAEKRKNQIRTLPMHDGT